MKKFLKTLLIILVFTSTLYAQIGIKAGVNMANQIKSLSSQDIVDGFNRENLTGYQVGLVYQLNPRKSGIGAEIAVLVSQKGFSFSDSLSTENSIARGYQELNYLEVPLNLRYKIKLGFLGVYGYAGGYAGYALNGRNVTETEDTSADIGFKDLMDRADYGYNLGLGLEFFNKIQFGVNLSQGLKDSNFTDDSTENTTINRAFSIGLTYLF
jgi:hypothetical protein